jgi:hypothetical protein
MLKRGCGCSKRLLEDLKMEEVKNLVHTTTGGVTVVKGIPIY